VKVKYVSPFRSHGYFEAARRHILGLARAGVEVSWAPMEPEDRWSLALRPFAGRAVGDPELDPFCNAPLDHDTVIIHAHPYHVPRWAAAEAGARVVAYTIWDTDRLPRGWAACLAGVARVLVPSAFCRRVFVAGGVRPPVAVVPYIADPAAAAVARPAPRAGGELVFYTVGTWTARKNVAGTIRCFLEAFTAEDAVRLVVKTSPFTYRESRVGALRPLLRAYRALRRARAAPAAPPRPDAAAAVERLRSRYPNPPPVDVIAGELTREQRLALHAAGDCFVSLSHAEGWCPEAFDAASCGSPVVVTGFGGPLDYLDPELAGLVGHDLERVRDDDDLAHFTRDQRWARPRTGEAVALLRAVRARPLEAAARAARLRRTVHERFGEAAGTRRLLAALAER